MAEDWRRLPDFPDYEISSFGRVRSRYELEDPIVDPVPVQGRAAVLLPDPETGERLYRFLLDLMLEWVEPNPAPGRYALQRRRPPWYDHRISNLAWIRIPGQKTLNRD